jgi:hypothetical protein
MTEPEAPRKADEPRREPNLRIVYSNDAPVSPRLDTAAGGAPTGARPVPVVPQKREAMLDRALQARIGGLLREVFGDTADSPVPDRFVKLLEELENKETSRDE